MTLDSNREPIVAGFGAGLRAQLMGYFVRADWAWGIENNYITAEDILLIIQSRFLIYTINVYFWIFHLKNQSNFDTI